MTDAPPGAPTPEQIAERAAAIRAEWSPAERMKRLRYDWRPLRWSLPGAPDATAELAGDELAEAG